MGTYEPNSMGLVWQVITRENLYHLSLTASLSTLWSHFCSTVTLRWNQTTNPPTDRLGGSGRRGFYGYQTIVEGQDATSISTSTSGPRPRSTATKTSLGRIHCRVLAINEPVSIILSVVSSSNLLLLKPYQAHPNFVLSKGRGKKNNWPPTLSRELHW